MEAVQVISVAALLRQSHPLTGAASLRPSSPSSPPSKKHKPSGETPIDSPLPLLDPNPNPNPISFSPLARPVILIGTISLLPNNHDHQNDCFSFSDVTSTVCCTFLDLDISIIGKTVRVLAWNFLPFSNGGILEIIGWSLVPFPSPSIRSHSLFQEENLLAFSDALQLVAVSPVFRVECGKNPQDGLGYIGFLAEVAEPEPGSSQGTRNIRQTFTKKRVVYFLGPAACWRPVLNKLVGKLIKVSGLRNKVVFVGKEESYEMLVSTGETVVTLLRFDTESVLSARRAVNERWIDGGTYVGVVTYIHSCMAVELDEETWLLITDPLLGPQHSLRVGSIVSVTNFHFVRPNFSWTRMLLLGTCSRTSITVQSFSPSETRLHFRNRRQSLLGDFIGSLSFSVRFWVLLLISCFRMKFARLFTDKEILGSKNQEGLVQIYARASLPSHAFQLKHGIFMEFCKHDRCNDRNDKDFGPLQLVTPISSFINKCERIWLSILAQMQNGAETIGFNSGSNHLSCQGMSFCSKIRKIISSKDLGLTLMGTLKISPSSGRLQLIDATGGVDVVVPDLRSIMDDKRIYEVKDYKLVLEGLPSELVSLRFHCSEPLSCKNIFQQFSYKNVLEQVEVYVHYYLNDSTCLDVHSLLPFCEVEGADLTACNGDIFHLLLVTHKSPSGNFQDASSLFAEAFVLPCDLVLRVDTEHNQLTQMFPGTVNKSREVNELIVSQIPCFLTFRNKATEESSAHGYLRYRDGTALENPSYSQWAQRILLEFESDSFFKYKSLHIGEYYILRCSNPGLCMQYRRLQGKEPWNSSCQFPYISLESFIFLKGAKSRLRRTLSG